MKWSATEFQTDGPCKKVTLWMWTLHCIAVVIMGTWTRRSLLAMWTREHGDWCRPPMSAWCRPSMQWSLVFDTENWGTLFRSMPKQMGFQLYEATVGMESTSFSIRLPMYHTMPKIKRLEWWRRATYLQLSQWFVKVVGRTRPGQMAGRRWHGMGSGLLSLSTPCWSRIMAVRSSHGDSTAHGPTSWPSFTSWHGTSPWCLLLSRAFYWECSVDQDIFITCFVLTVDKEGLQHLCESSRTWVWKAEKNQENISQLLRCSFLPQGSASCFSFEHFYLNLLLVAFITATAIHQEPVAFRVNAEDENLWNLATFVASNF